MIDERRRLVGALALSLLAREESVLFGRGHGNAGRTARTRGERGEVENLPVSKHTVVPRSRERNMQQGIP